MARRTVLVTGASGLVGTWLRRTAPSDVDVVSWVHRQVVAGPTVAGDLGDPDAANAAVDAVRPDLVIHAAYDKDERSIIDATSNVVTAVARTGAELIHLSSDMVFSGDGTERAETDRPDPIVDYGRWKADAECIVGDQLPTAAIVRPSLVLSLDPPDHVLVQIADGTPSNPTTWFVDEYRQPTMVVDIAGALWRLAGLDATERAGTWHLPGPERLDRFEIARRIVEAAGLDPKTTLATPTPAALIRPSDIWMNDDRARASIGWRPRPVVT